MRVFKVTLFVLFSLLLSLSSVTSVKTSLLLSATDSKPKSKPAATNKDSDKNKNTVSAVQLSEEKARMAMRSAEAQREDEKIANEMLNGDLPENEVESRRQALKQVSEQNNCAEEMRLVDRRNKFDKLQTTLARQHQRSSDIIVPLPSGTSGLASLLAIHSDLVKAGCMVTDHWCALGHCTFRSCFCGPIGPEQDKRPIVQAETNLKLDDKKLAVDSSLVKEKQVEMMDNGNNKKAEKLEKAEKNVENKLNKNKAAESKLVKAEAKIDQQAKGVDINAVCPPGWKVIPSPSQSFCKKAVF